LEPSHNVIGIGSGGTYALSAALALIDIPHMEPEDIVHKSMHIASEICVYTNNNLTIEIIDPNKPDPAKVVEIPPENVPTELKPIPKGVISGIPAITESC
jgi:hypothetical protein